MSSYLVTPPNIALPYDIDQGKTVVVTRKIAISFDTKEKEKIKDYWTQLFIWQRTCHRAANFVATHLFTIDKHVEMSYLVDETKEKFKDRAKDVAGIFNTSAPNTMYRLLSEKFKGTTPMAILSALSNEVFKNYFAEKQEVFKGEKSLRSYKKNIPVPTPVQLFRELRFDNETNNFKFSLNGIPFKTFLGRDKSNNRVMLKRCLEGHYKLCDSKIKIVKEEGNEDKKGGWQIYLMAVIRIPVIKAPIDQSKTVEARLDIETPIVAKFEDDYIKIGSREDFLYKRRQIQEALKRAQKECRQNGNNKGRKRIMARIERFEKAEVDFVNTKLHTYAKQLVDYAVKVGAGWLVLKELAEMKQSKKDPEYTLRNWGWSGLTEKIIHKASKVGIEVRVVDSEGDDIVKKSKTDKKKNSTEEELE